MNEVFVADTSIVTAMGNSIDEMWPGLCGGGSAIKPVHRFNTDRLVYHDAACVEGLEPDEGKNFICKLMSAAMDNLKPLPEDTFTIWTGIKGDVQFIEDRAEGREGRPPYLAKHYREGVDSYLGISNPG